MEDQAETQVFRYSKRQLWKLSAAGLGLILMMSFIVFELFGYRGRDDIGSRAMYVLACVALVFLVWALWVIVRKFRDVDTPVLVLSPEGFLDRRISARTIPWSDIVALERRELSVRGATSEYIAVTVAENHRAVRAMKLLDSMRFSGGRRNGLVDLYVMESGLGTPIAQLHDAIASYGERYAGAGGRQSLP